MQSCKTNVVRKGLRWTRISGYLPNLRHLLTHRDRWRETIREEKSREETEINAERAEERSRSSGFYSIDSKLRGVKTEIQKVCLKFPYLAEEIVIHSVKCFCFHLMGCFTPCWPGTQWVTIGISMPSISRSAGLRNLRTEHISSSQLCLWENQTSLISKPGVKDVFRALDAVTTVIIRWFANQGHTGS